VILINIKSGCGDSEYENLVAILLDEEDDCDSLSKKTKKRIRGGQTGNRAGNSRGKNDIEIMVL
jgi:hypothetical protein